MVMASERVDRWVSDQQEAARQNGDRVAYADAWTSRADAWTYRAVSIGIPLDYIDPTFGTWDIPENICWACWKPIEGPVVTLGVNAECRHHHPACYLSADFGRLYEGIHGRPACSSELPYYYA